MQPIESPLRDAHHPAAGVSSLNADEAEIDRQLTICNACRYCEGYCAVFPAMTRRLEFVKADIHYLANLCHNCGACLHACQYAPPHEFAVNVPMAMAKVRIRTYSEFAWPRTFAALYEHAGLSLALALAAGLALLLALAVLSSGSLSHQPLDSNFYAIFPHNTLALLFGLPFAYSVVALAIGAARFWRSVTPPDYLHLATSPAVAEAAQSALSLKYLDGGHGEGCNESDDAFTLLRRRFHHFTFYGFMLCLASTCLATLYHYLLGLSAPYAIGSLPVLLGCAGGVGLLIGPAGLLWLNLRRDPQHGDAAQKPMDRGFIALLLLTSLSGLALLAGRDTSAMLLLLAAHLGIVMAFFLTLPYGKFAHAVYRCAALLKWAIEKRQPSNLKLAED